MSNYRKVFKLVEIEMKDLVKGDMFCLDDECLGPECMSNTYMCLSKPLLVNGLITTNVKMVYGGTGA